MSLELSVTSCAEHAALPAVALSRARLTHAVWGRGLTLAQYLSREETLWREPLSRAGLRLWVLHDGGSALASLETYAVPVVAGRHAGVGHGVASVFVEEGLRHKGYASQLLSRVHDRLRTEGALLAYLMSEIDPALYQRLGYRPCPLRRRRFAASEPGRPDLAPGDPRVRFLCPAQSTEPAELADLLEGRYRPPLLSPVTLRMTTEQLGWHFARARFYADAAQKPAPPTFGVRAGDAFALWTPEHGIASQDPVLRILMLYPGPRLHAAGRIDDPRSPDAAAVRDVLHAARDEAARLGLPGVEVWENAVNAGWLRGGLPLPAKDLPMLLPLSRTQLGEWLDWERCHWL